MKKNKTKKILIVIMLCFCLCGCTKTLKDKDGNIIRNEKTGQNMTENIPSIIATKMNKNLISSNNENAAPVFLK